jgi:hypothetical protein
VLPALVPLGLSLLLLLLLYRTPLVSGAIRHAANW